MNTTYWERKVEEKKKEIYYTARDLLEEEEKRIGNIYSSLGSYIYLDSVEENIALWRYSYTSYYSDSTKYVFFYTDLNGKVLFGGKLFRFATAFSQGKALVFDFEDDRRPYILDIQNRTVITIPSNLGWKKISNFKNNRLALENANEKWGSMLINTDEKLIEPEIPFIWDYLAGSREKEIVYPGKTFIYTAYPNYEPGPYGHMVKDKDKGVDYECIKLARMSTADALTPKQFEMLESSITDGQWRHTESTRYMSSLLANPGDEYFFEAEKEHLCSTSGSIVDLGLVEDYQEVAYTLKR